MAHPTAKNVQHEYEEAGWSYLRGGGGSHFIYRCPCGRHLAVFSGTNTSERNQANALRPINRCKRERTYTPHDPR